MRLHCTASLFGSAVRLAGRISSADVDSLKAVCDISEIVSDYVALKPSSVGSLKGLCPFHAEKSPSFNVRPSQGFYHCFGCGAGGDVFKFLQEVESLTFAESVERVAAKYNFELHYDGTESTEGKDRVRILEANSAAALFYQENLELPEGEEARKILISRGFDESAVSQFGVGYAPQGWGGLLSQLTERGFTKDELIRAGLAMDSERGGYDRFRGRIMWPIRDSNNQVLGFGARKIYESDNGPKYLNTPETPAYHKGRVLYGLDLAKKEIVKNRQVVVVEGYTDVMACHLAGIKTAVATCGTAFGEEHIKLINRLLAGREGNPAEVIFTFDPDNAGVKAALRVYGDSTKFNALTYVASGPDGLDPSDLRQQRGNEAILEMMNTKKPLFEFVIRHRIAQFDLNTLEGRIAAARAAVPVVSQITDSALRSGYLRQLSEWVSLDLYEVEQLMTQSTSRQLVADVQPMRQGGAGLVTETEPGIDRTERAIAEVILQAPHEYSKVALMRIISTGFGNAKLTEITRVALANYESKQDPDWINQLANSLPEESQFLLRELVVAPLPASGAEELARYARGVIERGLLNAFTREKTDLLAALRRLDPISQSSEMAAVQHQLQELEKERRELSKG